MCYVFYVLALTIGFVFPAFLSAEGAGLSFAALWDLISLLITVGGSFFLVATASGTLSFYKDDKFLDMWGDLCLKMGYIGSVLGAIFAFAGMAMPPEAGIDPMAKIGGSLAVTLITILYGLIFKYMVIAPWLGCRRK
jgi:flagellar motor component MotA